MIAILGGAFLASLKIGTLEKSLNHYVARSRMPMALYKRLRAAAIERFTKVMREAPR